MFTISKLQVALEKVWTDELYSAEFKASLSKTKHFDHALKHAHKALGRLVEMTELADHGTPLDAAFPFEEVRKYLADIAICVARLSSVVPGGVDLELAVIDRLRDKMKLDIVA